MRTVSVQVGQNSRTSFFCPPTPATFHTLVVGSNPPNDNEVPINNPTDDNNPNKLHNHRQERNINDD